MKKWGRMTRRQGEEERGKDGTLSDSEEERKKMMRRRRRGSALRMARSPVISEVKKEE